MISIKTNLTSIDKIYHIADVHVRNMKRHTEYRQVFKRLYAYIKKTKTANSLIYVAGDVVHAKTDMSPELVDLVSEFFSELAKLAPTIVIAGNHDCNLNNSSRMDALYPIIKAMQEPNLYYLRDTDVYEIADVHFNVMSVFDKPSDFIAASSFEAKYKIALHHGAVNNATTDLGASLVNLHVTNDIFRGHDLVLLGDIHKYQFLNDDKTIAYPGSLIQQSHGEGLQHGILVWDLATKTSEFVKMENDYGYYTLEVVDGKLTNWIDDIPKKPRLRFRVTNTDSADLKEIVADVKQKRKIEEMTVQKVSNFKGTTANGKIVFANVRDVEYQNDLITDYLNTNHIVPDELVDAIRHINRTTNSKLIDATVARNVIWIPKRFEFSNMFSYGEDNWLDFENMTGTYGIFAANASGKSTLLDALAFCCFDRCSRTNKAIHVLNNKKTSFASKFEFELEGQRYFIERNGTKNSKNGHVRVDVNFYMVDVNGNETILNADQRDNTNKVIRQHIGEYEDFVLTALSLQNNNAGFIDKSQKDRKDLLASFLDINIFEQLYNIANDESKETVTLIKEYKRYDYSTIIAESTIEIEKTKHRLESLQTEKAEHDELVNGLNELIEAKTIELIPVDNTLDSPLIIQNQIDAAHKDIDVIKTDIVSKTNDLQTLIQDTATFAQKLDAVDEEQLRIDSNVLATRRDELKHYLHSMQQTEMNMKHVRSLVDKLATHEYDPECKFCIANPFVQDAEKSKLQLPTLEHDYLVFKDHVELLTETIKNDLTERKLEAVREIESTIEREKFKQEKLASDIELFRQKESNLTERINVLSERFDRSNAQIDAIQANTEIQSAIDELKDERNTLQTELKQIDTRIINATSHLSVTNKQLSDALSGVQKLREFETQNQAYDLYLDAIKRDGVPYLLIERVLPQIEHEINNILSQLVDFNIMLETDGKNINAYIVYDDDNFWPIELTSGMERFISSLAIRSSLINISSLPRPSFLAIDEGLGNLDSNMLTSIGMLFEYLKTQFQFTLLISHIDQARDMVDNIVELAKINGYSKIQYAVK
jgi:DNA repair exonuclease SbcCD ATPase subunit/predicted MPP superfamily phosphohydrolase